jgi:hypothetical protein
MKQYWFRAKRYGYGWVPVTWQGWAVVGVYLGGVLAGSRKATVGVTESSPFPYWFIVGWLVPLTILLLIICLVKGEKPGWRWGEPKR